MHAPCRNPTRSRNRRKVPRHSQSPLVPRIRIIALPCHVMSFSLSFHTNETILLLGGGNSLISPPSGFSLDDFWGIILCYASLCRIYNTIPSTALRTRGFAVRLSLLADISSHSSGYAKTAPLLLYFTVLYMHNLLNLQRNLPYGKVPKKQLPRVLTYSI